MMFNPRMLMTLMLKTRPMQCFFLQSTMPARIPRRFPRMHRQHFAICLYLQPHKKSHHSGGTSLQILTLYKQIWPYKVNFVIKNEGSHSVSMSRIRGLFFWCGVASRFRYPKYFTHIRYHLMPYLRCSMMQSLLCSPKCKEQQVLA